MEVRIGGERMVQLRGGSLVCADLEISANEQCEGLPSLDHSGTVWSHHPPVGKILAVPGIDVSAAGSARYDLGRDRIELPDPERFASRQAYYRTAIHEVGHWSGHPSRLNRPTLAAGLAGGRDAGPGPRLGSLTPLAWRGEPRSRTSSQGGGVGCDPCCCCGSGSVVAVLIRPLRANQIVETRQAIRSSTAGPVPVPSRPPEAKSVLQRELSDLSSPNFHGRRMGRAVGCDGFSLTRSRCHGMG